VPHDGLFGHLYGTKFEVCKKDRDVTLTPVYEENEILLQHGGQEEGDSNELVVSNDNRDLVDRNALTKGKESSQKLGASEIEELKQSGRDGKEVIKALIENSETFKQKTEFSQAKWLKRKTAKHVPSFRAVRCTSLSLCRAYLAKEPHRICHLREDSLARLLTLSNVQVRWPAAF
jgi:tRNA (adenine58-N1)-methyltransferase non-catalytic subunit